MSVTMLMITFLFLSSYVVCWAAPSTNINHDIQSHPESRKLNESIHDYLKKPRKPAVKTIKSPDGDLIDCVLFDQQPAFDHPLLQGQRNKTIQLPELPKGYLPDNNTAAFDQETFQVWRNSGESCPENTVPIRRTTEEDILRAQRFGSKKASAYGYNKHEHAIGRAQGQFFGAEATLNVWLPQIENDGEFSIAQIWVVSGSFDDDNLNSIEVGYQVLHGDKLPRLFVYWTSDAYQKTGCYNFDCSGYVQVNKNIAPGFTISPLSHYNSNQDQIKCAVWKSPENRDWWLAVNGVPIGYWPSALFPRLGPGSADRVEFGGEVVNTGVNGQHTTTQMGSGHFPKEGYSRAAYMKKLGLVNSENNVASAGKLQTIIENPTCYGAEAFESDDPEWHSYIYYGGPGRAGMGCI